MLKKQYEKSELWFAMGWIAVYCGAMSLGDAISGKIGIVNAVTLPVAVGLAASLFLFLKRNGLLQHYGLCRPRLSPGKMLYYLPVLLMFGVNLQYGLHPVLPTGEAILYVLTMLCVGFLEEVIFRGLLFRAMEKDGVRFAIAVSSVTFGMGHIINLFNGSGTELIPNLIQVCYATAAGFMFMMIYYRSESLLVCIGGHGIFNALSVFAEESRLTVSDRIGTCLYLVLVCGGYAIYLARAMVSEENPN